MNRLKQNAYHEAGHVVAALSVGSTVCEARIGKNSGYTYIEWNDASKQDTLLVFYSGLAAEFKKFNDMFALMAARSDMQMACDKAPHHKAFKQIDRATTFVCNEWNAVQRIARVLIKHQRVGKKKLLKLYLES